MSKTLHDEAKEVYLNLKRRFQKSGDDLDLKAMNVIEKAMKRVPKRTKKPVDKSKAQAEHQTEIKLFLFGEMQYSQQDAERTAEYLWMHWTENGWRNGGRPMRDWKLTVRKWTKCGHIPVGQKGFAKKRATRREDHNDGF